MMPEDRTAAGVADEGVFCDSTGLRLVLAGPQLLRIFAVTGFDQLFPIFGTPAQALAGRGRDAGQ
jgi:hypothetical protein